jgi:diketogulonate reductase-like aldo/keto reductase
MTKSTMPMIALSSKTTIPQLGFGTWLIKKESVCKDAVKAALEAGYRHFDTAQIYNNEQFVGAALKESGLPRNELFITTKIWNDNMYWDDLVESLDESLEKLQTDYADLLLLHFPVTELRGPAWQRMEDVHKAGKAKAIGVSNYTVRHLEELLNKCTIKPAVNQVELHVFLQQPELVAYCRQNDIALEAYSPLAHGYDMKHKVLADIAQKHQKSVAKVMIRWCLEQGFVTIPKSTHPARIKENFETLDFHLDADDLQQISELERGLRTCWDPTNVA